tara:strand:+ start:16 stop:546 length:531 start_codon:yes stop_codon:yes gene_type:complete
MNNKSIIETILFSSENSISNNIIRKVLNQDLSDIEINKIIGELNNEYKKNKKGIYIDSISNGYQIRTLPEFHKYIRIVKNSDQKYKLSQAGLEILSIIAFKQPVSRLDIELIRGVDSIGAIKNLLDKKLIKIKTSKGNMQKSLLYKTSDLFLDIFGLHSIEELKNTKDFNEGIKKI